MDVADNWAGESVGDNALCANAAGSHPEDASAASPCNSWRRFIGRRGVPVSTPAVIVLSLRDPRAGALSGPRAVVVKKWRLFHLTPFFLLRIVCYNHFDSIFF